MACLVAMGGFIFGYDTGQISGFLEMHVFLERFGEQVTVSSAHPTGYRFSNVRSGLIVGLLSIGTLVGCLVAGPFANRYGRKWCIPVWSMVFMLGVVIQMAMGSGKWVGIAMGRWVAGLGVGGLSVLVPLYMSETSPVPVRGAVVSCYQLFITIGIFTADCINYGTESRGDTGSYRIPMGVGYIWALILGLGILFLPESPRHDFNHDRPARARTTMSMFYGLPESHPLIVSETGEIEKVMRATSGPHPWYEIFTAPRMPYRVLLAMALQMLQQLTGANYFFYYGTSIFTGVGIRNSYVTAMILGGVNVGATVFGVWLAGSRWSRRRESLYVAALWQCMCFLVFASVGQFVFKDSTEGSSTAKTSGYVMIVFACLFIVSFASTWGPLVWACISEMFPYRYRAVGMALATSANWFWNFMLAFFTPFITGSINYAYGYVFAGCNLAGFLVVYLFLIESSDRTLEEVDAMYLLHVPPRGSGHFCFDEKTKAMIGEGLGTDRMELEREDGGEGGGKGVLPGMGRMRKRGEAEREGVVQDEGVLRKEGEGMRSG
ncbi:MFS sugar transporter [Marssonina coronariae]|uniref:MFS sugar transporter n=1 Tax=Diplocarpon coronariae TaxID=2795749 RepID=A0A218Z0Y6_9HELO|nr:MFS sugar transporter [Marssonina coronariae]